MNTESTLLKFLMKLEKDHKKSEQIMFTIRDSRDLINHGESVVAFENILNNLYEFYVPLSPKDMEIIETIAEDYNLSKSCCVHLYENIDEEK